MPLCLFLPGKWGTAPPAPRRVRGDRGGVWRGCAAGAGERGVAPAYGLPGRVGSALAPEPPAADLPASCSAPVTGLQTGTGGPMSAPEPGTSSSLAPI